MLNLRQLGTYIFLYADRYGSGESYPPARGHRYLCTLFTIPTPSTAVASGQETLGSCYLARSRAGQSSFDYREPIGQLVDGLTRPTRPVLCDQPSNHDPLGEDDINVLLFSGSVVTVEFGSPEWNEALLYTK